MSRKTLSIAITALVLVVVLMGALRLQRTEAQKFCGFCHRPIHARTQVIAEVDGHRKTVCCARCAITEAFQEKKPVRLIEVTDFVSGKPLRPEQAYFVDGSRKVLCDHDSAMLDQSKQVYHLAFDRCFPGAYAFARREDAVAFARENGGAVLQLNEMLQGVNRK